MTTDDTTAAAGWPARFSKVTLIRERGTVALYAARDRDLAQDVVLAAPAAGADEATAARLLDAMAAGHAPLRHPLVPSVIERGRFGDLELLVWDCDARFDAQHITERLARRPDERLPYAAAIGFTDTLLSVLAHAHDQRDAQGRPVCIGGVAWGDILLAPEGHWWVTGFGRNSSASLGVCYAPEVAAGAPCSPGADVFALQLLLRAATPSVDMPAPMRNAFAGQGDPHIMAWFREVEDVIMADDPRKRPQSAGAIRHRYEDHWHRMGVWPDGQQMRTLIRKMFANDAKPSRPQVSTQPQQPSVAPAADGLASGDGSVVDQPGPSSAGGGFVVHQNGDWFVASDGRRVPLRRRRALRAILSLLVRNAGTPLSLAALQRAGWPGQRLARSSGRNRTYVAISTLRGLGAPIARDGEGYLLPARLAIENA